MSTCEHILNLHRPFNGSFAYHIEPLSVMAFYSFNLPKNPKQSFLEKNPIIFIQNHQFLFKEKWIYLDRTKYISNEIIAE